ncbi:MAG: hypothetical protein ACREF3_04925, partial [Acetobacteraceae bacterium]
MLSVSSVRPATVSPLATFALTGLRHCWLEQNQTWSHKYHLDGRNPPNESVPPSDIYYSLNVLLGLSKVRQVLAHEPYPPPVILLEHLDQALPRHNVRNGAWGMALWAAAALELNAPASAMSRMKQLAADPTGTASWTAQDIGLTLSGAVAYADSEPWLRPFADYLAGFILERLRVRSALFRDAAVGPRRQFATFASQVYAALSLYHYGELTSNATAIGAANDCVSKLITLQGPHGEWPWFYRPAAGRVVEPYEVYSVHQHGMGPALLQYAARHQVPDAHGSIRIGFEWLFGRNQMQVSMFVPNLSLIYRSQARRGAGGSRFGRLLLSGTN